METEIEAKSGLAALWESSIGKKVAMAVTGAILFGFVIGHLAGNLLVFSGREAVNAYARWLRDHAALLWGTRLLLLASVGVHIVAAIELALQRRSARPTGYSIVAPRASTYASRTMYVSGPLIAAYVIYHILHMTLGAVHPKFDDADVYRNVVLGFQQWPVSVVYAVAMILLGMHLYHGLWSAFQTVGLNSARVHSALRCLSAFAAAAITAGYLSIPAAVLAGFLPP